MENKPQPRSAREKSSPRHHHAVVACHIDGHIDGQDLPHVVGGENQMLPGALRGIDHREEALSPEQAPDAPGEGPHTAAPPGHVEAGTDIDIKTGGHGQHRPRLCEDATPFIQFESERGESRAVKHSMVHGQAVRAVGQKSSAWLLILLRRT